MNNILSVLEAWQTESGVRGHIQYSLDVFKDKLILYTAEKEKYVGKNKKLLKKYRQMFQETTSIKDVEVVLSGRKQSGATYDLNDDMAYTGF